MSKTRKHQRPKGRSRGYLEHRWDDECPTPTKLRFDTREQAEKVLRYSHHGGRNLKPSRVYLCPCGSFHWASGMYH